MDETPVYKFPFPEDSDAPDGPTQIEALAEALDGIQWASRSLGLTAGIQAASEDLVLTTSYADIPGASKKITPDVESLLIVVAFFEFVDSPGECWGTIKLDSNSEETALAKWSHDAGVNRGTAGQIYALTLSAAEHTVKLRAKKNAGTGTAAKLGTRFGYLLLAV